MDEARTSNAFTSGARAFRRNRETRRRREPARNSHVSSKADGRHPQSLARRQGQKLIRSCPASIATSSGNLDSKSILVLYRKQLTMRQTRAHAHTPECRGLFPTSRCSMSNRPGRYCPIIRSPIIGNTALAVAPASLIVPSVTRHLSAQHLRRDLWSGPLGYQETICSIAFCISSGLISLMWVAIDHW